MITTTYISSPLITSKYILEMVNGNDIDVEVDFNDTYFYYKAFNNDTLKVKRNGIKMFNPNKGKWEKILKVPNSANIFRRYNDSSSGLNGFL